MCSISGFKKVAQYWATTGFCCGESVDAFKRSEHFSKCAPLQPRLLSRRGAHASSVPRSASCRAHSFRTSAIHVSGRVGVPPAVLRVSRSTFARPKIFPRAEPLGCVPRDAEHGGRDAHPTRNLSGFVIFLLLLCHLAATRPLHAAPVEAAAEKALSIVR